MKKSRKKAKSFWWLVLTTAFLLLLGPPIWQTYQDIQKKQDELTRWKKKEESLRNANRELKERISSLQTKEEMEKLARDMGYIKLGEEAYRVINQEQRGLSKEAEKE